jgi:Glycosyltransferase family 87
VLAVAVALSFFYALVIGVVAPPNNSDSMTYRLSRAAAWFQHGGIHWIENPHTERVNEFPANSEFELLYTFAFLDGDAAAVLPQLVAAAALVLAVTGLARRLGYGRPASAFAGLLTATLAEFALQATSTQNDLVTASFVTAAAYFLTGGKPLELCVGGAAIGLALGNKLTAYVVVPVVGLLAVVSLPRRRIALAAATGAMGFVLFAAYVPLLNVVHTSAPGGRMQEQDIYRPTLTARGTASTFARAHYRFIDFSGIPGVKPSWLEPVEEAGERTFDALGIPANPPESSATFFDFGINFRSHEDHSFFGPLGFLVVLPLSVVFAVAWPMRRTDAAHGLYALALPLFVLVLALVFRFDDEGRYLIVPVALVMPLAASRYRWRLVAAAAAAIGIVTMAGVHVDNELKPIGTGTRHAVWRLMRPEAQSLDVPRRAPLLAAVERRVPEDAEVAVAFTPSDWDYPLYGASLDRRVTEVDLDCPVRDAERRRLDYLVLGASAGWPGPHPGWTIERFPRAGTLLVRTAPRAAGSPQPPCFVATRPK